LAHRIKARLTSGFIGRISSCQFFSITDITPSGVRRDSHKGTARRTKVVNQRNTALIEFRRGGASADGSHCAESASRRGSS
jgi:hypothetical protein